MALSELFAEMTLLYRAIVVFFSAHPGIGFSELFSSSIHAGTTTTTCRIQHRWPARSRHRLCALLLGVNHAAFHREKRRCHAGHALEHAEDARIDCSSCDSTATIR
jgi:hypothetical protein